MEKTFLRVRKIEDNSVVKEIDLTGKTERYIEKVDAGLNINLNHEQYYSVVEKEEYVRIGKGDAGTPERFWAYKIVKKEDVDDYLKYGWFISANQEAE